jgi:hypothetical protein
MWGRWPWRVSPPLAPRASFKPAKNLYRMYTLYRLYSGVQNFPQTVLTARPSKGRDPDRRAQGQPAIAFPTRQIGRGRSLRGRRLTLVGQGAFTRASTAAQPR